MAKTNLVIVPYSPYPFATNGHSVLSLFVESRPAPRDAVFCGCEVLRSRSFASTQDCSLLAEQEGRFWTNCHQYTSAALTRPLHPLLSLLLTLLCTYALIGLPYFNTKSSVSSSSFCYMILNLPFEPLIIHARARCPFCERFPSRTSTPPFSFPLHTRSTSFPDCTGMPHFSSFT
ncbi:hypothetical protein TSMEX_004699 [Taenia solium]|eukprot:TsM_000170700 transcript=TsM_000170700 gene=TsM_000170700